ncbi:MAG: TPM domain-containing protein [Candidatus Riflemargulisbacteria bacterium]
MLNFLNKKAPLRLLFIIISLYLSLFSFSFSAGITQRVFDEAGLLDNTNTIKLEQIILDWETKTKHQMAVITVKSLNGVEIEEFAIKKFEELGIGNKERNDGLLFIVAPNDRKLRIEVGYGLESYLPDGLVGEIRDTYIVPNFRNNDFPAGILQGTYSLLMKEAEMEGINLPQLGTGEPPAVPAKTVPPSKGSIAGIIFFIVIILIMLSNKTGRSILLWSLLASSMGGSSRSNNSFGSFGGGFGGFGGGFSGGGGASGNW